MAIDKSVEWIACKCNPAGLIHYDDGQDVKYESYMIGNTQYSKPIGFERPSGWYMYDHEYDDANGDKLNFCPWCGAKL